MKGEGEKGGDDFGCLEESGCEECRQNRFVVKELECSYGGLQVGRKRERRREWGNGRGVRNDREGLGMRSSEYM